MKTRKTTDADSAAASHPGPQGRAAALPPGAPPSNTAPANYTQGPGTFHLLRLGVDSLYLSYPGELASQWEQRLEGLKRAAQAEEALQRAIAQVRIGEHLFEVMGRGQQRFPYILADNVFYLALSRSRSMPMAYCQIASELLTAQGVQAAETALRFVVGTFGRVDDTANISRVDICVDFVSDVVMDAWKPDAWVTRAQDIVPYYQNGCFTGWSIGPGGIIHARLYDKTEELKKSRKTHFYQPWEAQGWQPGQTVWRLEFQIRREALVEMGIRKIADLEANYMRLWQYLTRQWLRLTIPGKGKNQSRRPNHPLWDCLAAVDWGTPSEPSLVRVRYERVPHDDALFLNGLAGLTAFMARHGITDLDEGIGEFIARADCYHQQRAGNRRGFRDYIAEKVADKSKRYNTLDNRDPKQRKRNKKRAANAYKKGRDGE